MKRYTIQDSIISGLKHTIRNKNKIIRYHSERHKEYKERNNRLKEDLFIAKRKIKYLEYTNEKY